LKVTNKVDILNPSLKNEERINEITQAANRLLTKNADKPLIKITIIFERGSLSVKESEEIE
jgi:hypothetical protein